MSCDLAIRRPDCEGDVFKTKYVKRCYTQISNDVVSTELHVIYHCISAPLH